MHKVFDNLTESEIKVLKKGLSGQRKAAKHNHSFSSKSIKFGYFADAHIGSKEFDWNLWDKMVAYFKKEGIKTVYSAGDIVEGMSNRPGQIYDLEAIGFRAQVKLAAQAISMLGNIQVYGILGNHDLWFKDKSGVDASVGEALEDKCDNYHHLGDWEARVKLAKGVEMLLYHGADGSAYAISYKLQKLVEFLEGGCKPQIILSGHYHKALYMFTRNVHAFECGTLCSQTQWMRGKKLAAHKGFGVVSLTVGSGIETLTHTFIPQY